MLIRRGTLLDGRVADVRVDERIVDVGDCLEPHPGEHVHDAALGAVLPGLHDHHLHLRAAAAALDSITAGPPTVRTPEQLTAALTAAVPGDDGWIRAVGYHDSVAGALDAAALDAMRPDVPLRVQHRSGALWILNSAGLASVGLPDHPDGRLKAMDRSWSATLPQREAGLAEVSRRLLALGVTGVTDATPDLSAEDIVTLTMARRHGEIRQRLHFLSPSKRILHDDHLDVDELTGWIAGHHAAGRKVAVHCVTAAQLVVTIAALRAAGTRRGDRIEHAAVVPEDAIADLLDLGVLVVTQPNFVAERGEQYLQDVAAEELPDLWRVASLSGAGIPVAGSTDAPFGTGDPWASMRAAVRRRAETGEVLGSAEAISPLQALEMFLGSANQPAVPRTVAPGEPGDLCVLRVPPQDALQTLASDLVALTVVGGRFTS